MAGLQRACVQVGDVSRRSSMVYGSVRGWDRETGLLDRAKFRDVLTENLTQKVYVLALDKYRVHTSM